MSGNVARFGLESVVYVHKGAPARVTPFFIGSICPALCAENGTLRALRSPFWHTVLVTLSRRLVCAIVLSATLLAACQGPSVTGTPKLASDQTLRVMLEDQPASLDPGQTQYTF